MMQPLRCSTLFLLCSLFPSGLSLQCNQTQYAWPADTLKHCCNKCPPGLHMEPRRSKICDTKCKPCTGDRFMDSYNTELSCKICDICNKPNFVTESSCTTTRNTVCKCKTGYMCKDKTCTKCVTIPTSTKPTPTAHTTAFKPATSRAPNQPIKDTAWFLVIIALLCAGITLVVLTRIKSFLQWIRANHGYFLAEKPSSEPSSSEDDVSMPVQEVCGKCDQPLEICIKD